jgi:hypothetical protein
VAEGLSVVGVFIAGGDLIDALSDQVEEGVLDALAASGIGASGGDGLGETQTPVEASQEEEAAVGRERATGKINLDRLAGQERKGHDGLRTGHGGMFPFSVSSCVINSLYTEQTRHPFSIVPLLRNTLSSFQARRE